MIGQPLDELDDDAALDDRDVVAAPVSASVVLEDDIVVAVFYGEPGSDGERWIVKQRANGRSRFATGQSERWVNEFLSK